MNYYERHIGDYLKDTAHLCLLEHGIYTRLLDLYYTREGGLPQGDVARLLGARTKEERAALALVLQEFFVLQGDVYVQPRCDREIAHYLDKQAKARRSAQARWRPEAAQGEGAAPSTAAEHTNVDAHADTAAQAHADAEAANVHEVVHPHAHAHRMRSHSGANAPNHQTPDTNNQTPTPKPPLAAARRLAAAAQPLTTLRSTAPNPNRVVGARGGGTFGATSGAGKGAGIGAVAGSVAGSGASSGAGSSILPGAI